jgi:hypothetical protein
VDRYGWTAFGVSLRSEELLAEVGGPANGGTVWHDDRSSKAAGIIFCVQCLVTQYDMWRFWYTTRSRA